MDLNFNISKKGHIGLEGGPNAVPYMQNTYVGISTIHGRGLMANKDLDVNDIIGLAHSNGEPTHDIGEWINHSEKPNTESIMMLGGQRYLKPLRKLKEGEEITVDYRRQPELEQPDNFFKGMSTSVKPKSSVKGWGNLNTERGNINLMGGFNSPHLSGFAMGHMPASAQQREYFPGFVTSNIQGKLSLGDNLTFSGGPSATFMPGQKPQWGVTGGLKYKLPYRKEGGDHGCKCTGHPIHPDGSMHIDCCSYFPPIPTYADSAYLYYNTGFTDVPREDGFYNRIPIGMSDNNTRKATHKFLNAQEMKDLKSSPDWNLDPFLQPVSSEFVTGHVGQNNVPDIIRNYKSNSSFSDIERIERAPIKPIGYNVIEYQDINPTESAKQGVPVWSKPAYIWNARYPKPTGKPTPERSASSLARKAKRDALTQEMKDAGFTGYSAREVLKPGSDAAKAWEAFQNQSTVGAVQQKEQPTIEEKIVPQQKTELSIYSPKQGDIRMPGYRAGDGKEYGAYYLSTDGTKHPIGPTREEGALMGVSGLSNFLPKETVKMQSGGLKYNQGGPFGPPEPPPDDEPVNAITSEVLQDALMEQVLSDKRALTDEQIRVNEATKRLLELAQRKDQKNIPTRTDLFWIKKGRYFCNSHTCELMRDAGFTVPESSPGDKRWRPGDPFPLIPGNIQMKGNMQKLGFIPVSESQLRPGDFSQEEIYKRKDYQGNVFGVPRWVPSHSTIYSGSGKYYNAPGGSRYDYANLPLENFLIPGARMKSWRYVGDTPALEEQLAQSREAARRAPLFKMPTLKPKLVETRSKNGNHKGLTDREFLENLKKTYRSII